MHMHAMLIIDVAIVPSVCSRLQDCKELAIGLIDPIGRSGVVVWPSEWHLSYYNL